MAKNKQPIILVDFSKTPDENINSIYPLSDAIMAHSLNDSWTPEDVRRVNSQHGLYRDIPWMCAGEACPASAYCPIIEEGFIDNYIGKNCPVEIVEAFKLFAGYVLDLSILPTDFTDIQTIVDLVRLHILIRRCDLYQKNKPIYDYKSGAVVQKTGVVKRDKIPNLGFEMTTKLRNDLSKKYDSLIATRKEKLRAETSLGKGKSDLAQIFSSLTSAGAKAQELKELQEKNDDSIEDAEYKEEDNT